jgi:hypothetical protein
MWVQIPALLICRKGCSTNPPKRLPATNNIGNHPRKRAHNRGNTRILSPRMGFEARLHSVARSAQYRQSFCMENRSKVHVSVQSSSIAHCNRRGAAPRAPISSKICSLDAPETQEAKCGQFGAHAGAPGGKMRAILQFRLNSV